MILYIASEERGFLVIMYTSAKILLATTVRRKRVAPSFIPVISVRIVSTSIWIKYTIVLSFLNVSNNLLFPFILIDSINNGSAR